MYGSSACIRQINQFNQIILENQNVCYRTMTRSVNEDTSLKPGLARKILFTSLVLAIQHSDDLHMLFLLNMGYARSSLGDRWFGFGITQPKTRPKFACY